MRILVTGATGFVGSAFTRLAVNDHEVTALVRPESYDAAKKHLPSKVRIISQSLTEFASQRNSSFRADACVHAAWIATPGAYLESAENEVWKSWSLDFLKRVAAMGTAQIMVLGTCIEYQMGEEPLSEEKTPIKPTSTYARCKNDLRLALEQEKDISLCWGRVFYPYGPNEHPDRLASSLIRKCSKNERLVLKTPGSTKDYIYIDDLASAILTAVEKRFVGPINLGSGHGVQVREIASTIASEMGKLDLIEEISPSVADPYGCVVADAAKLFRLGWKPKTNLREGLKKLMVSVQTGNKV